MVLYIGDTHGILEINKLSAFVNVLGEEDYLVVLGDFGLLWSEKDDDIQKESLQWLSWLEQQSFTTLFIDGNHENFHILNSYPIEMWNGGKVHKINSKVIHLMRGQVFKIDGYTYFTMGGASFIDRYRRIEKVDWWQEEMPSDEEYNEALCNLDKCDWRVNFVLTHSAPNHILPLIGQHMQKDKLTCFLESISDDLDFDCWFFGHFHTDSCFKDKRGKTYICSYHKLCF